MAITLDGSDNKIAIGANATGSAYLRLYEDTDNGTNYVDIIAPASITSNRTLTLPDNSGTLLTNSGTEAGAFSTLSVNSNNISAENSLGFRNRIINGDMRIDQRNAGAAVTVNTASNQYSVDRWKVEGQATDGVFTAQKDTSVPTGFNNSLKITVTTADASIGSTQRYQVIQVLEGYNVADLGFGAAGAKTTTLSFWVRSSLTGTFGGSYRNSATNRSYPFSYTISVADTWEYKTVTIAGDTSGTWLKESDSGIILTFSMGSGTNFQGTAGAWNSNNNNTVTGETQVIGTLNATWYITGVQLEVGSVATPFERRDYGRELAMCYRYYYRIVSGADDPFGMAFCVATTLTSGMVQFPVTMRVSPSSLETNGTASDYRVRHGGSSTNCSSVPAFSDSSPSAARITFTVASGLTLGQGAMMSSSVNGNVYLGFSSEL